MLDLPAETKFSEHSTANVKRISLVCPLAQALPPVAITDPLVSGVTVRPDAHGKAVFTVTLAHARKSSVFTLPASGDKPFRLVLDILTAFSHETRERLTPAIQYIYLERQQGDDYLAAHLLEINARDAHARFAVVPAAGAHETVSVMVARLHAVGGVNGGYFLEGTRPVGLLKSGGMIRSLPIWRRSAVAFPAHGMPLFANPVGCWRVTLPDGSTRDMTDWTDAAISPTPPMCRVISGNSLLGVPAVPQAVVAIIRAGKVVARPTASSPLARGDFALVLCGDAAKALDALLTPGTSVAITPVITSPAWGEYLNAVGAGPRLLKAGVPALAGNAEHFSADILNGRHARTAFGVTGDGRVLLVVVEKPGSYGGGATLEEMAALLKAYGADEAINLDGGGSSTLAIGDRAVNYPTKSWVRPVASGVLVFDDRSPLPVVTTPSSMKE